MSVEKFILWFTVMAPIAYSAGPNNLMCASIGARFGFKRSLPFIAGVNSNILLYSVLTGFGLGTLLGTFPQVFVIIKYVGSAYILYLAYLFFRNSGSLKTKNEKDNIPGFWNGVILNALNPKGFTALVIMYSQFLDNQYNIFNQVVLMTIMVVVMSISSHLLWSSGGYWILGRMTSPKSNKILGILFGSMLIIVAIWMLLD